MRLLGPRYRSPISAPVRRRERSTLFWVRRIPIPLLPPLTPLVDSFLAMILLLLNQFHVPMAPVIEPRVRVPSARNVMDVIEAPLVTITPTSVLVDGVPAGSELGIILKHKRELSRQANPDSHFPGVVAMRVDASTPSALVKNAVRSATQAGYPQIEFLVRRRASRD